MINHPIHKIESFEIVGNYTLLVTFNDGHRQQIDFRPMLAGEL